MTLKAGTAIIEITPPPGTMMAAFPAKRGTPPEPRRARGAHDPLFVRSLALSDGETTVILCSADLCAIRRFCLERIRDDVARERPDVPRENILINVSHTHSGPETTFLFGASPDMAFVRDVERRIVEAAVAAMDRMESVSVTRGKSSLELNHNRRVLNEEGKAMMRMEHEPGVTTGPVDHDLRVIRFDRGNGDPMALLYHYTAHALTLGPKNDKFSADFPGVASTKIEAAFPGCQALFLNGATGNLHPRQCMRAGTEARDAVGAKLADAVIKTARSADHAEDGKLRLVSDLMTFANRSDSSLTVPVEIDVLTIGDFVLGFVPGEFFVEHQLAFKRGIAPAEGTLVAYANGWPGYVPDKKSYAEGGYGVDLAGNDPPEHSRTAMPEGAGETVVERLLELASPPSGINQPDNGY